MEQVSKGESVYSAHAKSTMGYQGGNLKKDDPRLYALAKARCLSADTLVLTDRGYLPIIQVSLQDRVWDGLSWVEHKGVIQSGVCETIDVLGDQYTKEHELYVGDQDTTTASGVREDGTAAISAYRAKCALPSWDEIWVLARAVSRVYLEVGISVCALPMRALRNRLFCVGPVLAPWKSFLRTLSGSPLRGPNADTAVGETTGRVGPGAPPTTQKYNGEVL